MKLTRTHPTVPGLALTVMLAAVLVPVTDVAGTAGSLGTPLPATVGLRVFHVRASGALPDGKTESGNAIRAAIQAALKAGPGSEVALEAGTYLVTPRAPREACFPISGAADLVVRGEGKATKIVITDPAAGGFSVGFGRQVTLRDFVIDYDPVPFCQGTIRAVDIEAGCFDLEVETGYPTPDAENSVKAIEPYGKWGMIVDRTTRRIRAGTPDHYMTPRWEHREGRTWRFFTADEYHRRNLTHMRIGDAYVHLARGYGSAVLAQGCDGIHIENVVGCKYGSSISVVDCWIYRHVGRECCQAQRGFRDGGHRLLRQRVLIPNLVEQPIFLCACMSLSL
jgi:hypothetical protein